jgi:hypothetical protein
MTYVPASTFTTSPAFADAIMAFICPRFMPAVMVRLATGDRLNAVLFAVPRFKVSIASDVEATDKMAQQKINFLRCVFIWIIFSR